MVNRIHFLAALLEVTKDADVVMDHIKKSTNPVSVFPLISKIKESWCTIADAQCGKDAGHCCNREKLAREMKAAGVPAKKVKEFVGLSLSEMCRERSKIIASALDLDEQDRADLAPLEEYLVSHPIVPRYVCALKVANSERRAIVKTQARRLEDKLSTVNEINSTALLEEMRYLLAHASTSDPHELAGAVALATGRRHAEVYHSASFHPAPKKDQKHFCRVTGLLKKRGGGGDDIIIPILAPLSEIAKAIKILRTDRPSDSHTDAARRYNSSANLAVRRAFGEFCSRSISFHTLRSIYVLIAFKTSSSGEASGTTFPSFAMKTLGHDGLESQLHYSSIKLV